MTKILVLLVLSVFAFCNTSNAQIKDLVIGTWALDQVMEASDDVTSEHDPHDERWIRFDANGSFESDGRPFGVNTGKWRIDESMNVLYLDSDTEGNDSEWAVFFKDDEMIWRGVGDARKATFQLFYTAVGAP